MTSTASHLSTAPGLALSSGLAADGNDDQDYRTNGPSESALSADWNGPAPDTGADRSAAVPGRQKPLRSWPLLVLAAPAAVAVWSGWVGIGQMTGFGRRFARWSAIAALVLGMAGQVAYHLLAQAGVTRAPWEVTTVVSCLPVLVLGMGSALAHLLRSDASLASAQAHFISLQTSDQKLTGQYVRDGSGQEQPGLQAHITSARPDCPDAALVQHHDGTAATREPPWPPARALNARPPARMRPSEAYTAAARARR